MTLGFKKIADTFNRTHEVFNFTVNPQEYIQFEPGLHGKKAGKRDQTTGIYIGKMFKRNHDNIGNIYSKDTLQGLLDIIKRTSKENDTVHIYIGSVLYDTLAKNNIKKDILSLDEQKKLLYSYAKKVGFSKDQIIITGWQENHSELCNGLQMNGIDSIQHERHLDILDTSTSSKLLAEFLYTMSEKYPHIYKAFASITPPYLTNTLPAKDPLFYYGLLEIAIRITDGIQGITTQGGYMGQKKFDETLKYITSGKTGATELDALFATQDKHIGENTAKRYFKDQKYKKVIANNEIKKGIVKKTIKTVGLVTAASILGIISRNKYADNQRKISNLILEKNKQEQLTKNIKEYIKNKNIQSFYNITLDTNKVNYVTDGIEGYTHDVRLIYGLEGLSDDEIKIKIVGALLDHPQKPVGKGWGVQAGKDFIIDAFSSLHKKDLELRGYSMIPYVFDGKLAEWEKEGVLMNTLLCSSDILNTIEDEKSCVVMDSYTWRSRKFQKVQYKNNYYLRMNYSEGDNKDYFTIAQANLFVSDVYKKRFPILYNLIDVAQEKLLSPSGIYREFGSYHHYDEVKFNYDIEPILITTALKHQESLLQLQQNHTKTRQDIINYFETIIYPDIKEKIKNIDRAHKID